MFFQNLKVLREKIWIYDIRKVYEAYRKGNYAVAIQLSSDMNFEGRNALVVKLISACCQHELKHYSASAIAYSDVKSELREMSHFDEATTQYLVNFCNRGLGYPQEFVVDPKSVEKTVRGIFI